MIIIYSRKNDTMVARFSATWIDKLKEYYRIHLNIDYDIIDCVVHKYITKLEGDGFRAYAMAKCSPDDVFDEEIGKHIARTRLINKYNRVVAGINQILIELIKSDMRFLRTRQRWQNMPVR